MRRSNGPRFFASKNGWYAEINQRRTRLCDGPKNKQTEQQAWELWTKLNQVRSVEIDGDRAEVWSILNAYLHHAKTRFDPVTPRTWDYMQILCKHFIACEVNGKKLGQLQVRDLKPAHIEAFLTSGRSVRKWSNNYCLMAVQILKTAFNWAAGDGDLISENPLARRGKKMRLPSPDKSLRRLAITLEEHETLVSLVKSRRKSELPQLLELLWATGARPSEIHQAEAEEWDRELQAFVIDPANPKNIGRLKNRRSLLRRKRKRVIRVPNHLVPMVETLIEKHQKGKLFHAENGSAWSNRKIATRMANVVRRAIKRGKPVRPKLTLYSYRHSFVTRWLTQGRSPSRLAELINTSLQMLQDHYSHLLEEHESFRNEVNDFTGTSQPPAPQPQTLPFRRTAASE